MAVTGGGTIGGGLESDVSDHSGSDDEDEEDEEEGVDEDEEGDGEDEEEDEEEEESPFEQLNPSRRPGMWEPVGELPHTIILSLPRDERGGKLWRVLEMERVDFGDHTPKRLKIASARTDGTGSFESRVFR